MKRTHLSRRLVARAARSHVAVCLWGAARGARTCVASSGAGVVRARHRAAQRRACAPRAPPAPPFSRPPPVISWRTHLSRTANGAVEACSWLVAAAWWRCAARHAKQLWWRPGRQRSRQRTARRGRGPGVNLHYCMSWCMTWGESGRVAARHGAVHGSLFARLPWLSQAEDAVIKEHLMCHSTRARSARVVQRSQQLVTVLAVVPADRELQDRRIPSACAPGAPRLDRAGPPSQNMVIFAVLGACVHVSGNDTRLRPTGGPMRVRGAANHGRVQLLWAETSACRVWLLDRFHGVGDGTR